MRLVELEPRWIVKDGKRIGFLFRNPKRGNNGWWTTCFLSPTPEAEQEALVEAMIGEDALYQRCNPSCGWRIVNATPEAASFDSISIQPSLDGGPKLWHGFITNGEVT